MICENLENWNGLQKASIDHFAQTGKASGSFLLALMDYAEQYHVIELERLRINGIK